MYVPPQRYYLVPGQVDGEAMQRDTVLDGGSSICCISIGLAAKLTDHVRGLQVTMPFECVGGRWDVIRLTWPMSMR